MQECVDFYFPLCASWFGLPDDLKTRPDQQKYRIRGGTNDEMRQIWLSRVVPYSESVGHKDSKHTTTQSVVSLFLITKHLFD